MRDGWKGECAGWPRQKTRLTRGRVMCGATSLNVTQDVRPWLVDAYQRACVGDASVQRVCVMYQLVISLQGSDSIKKFLLIGVDIMDESRPNPRRRFCFFFFKQKTAYEMIW